MAAAVERPSSKSFASTWPERSSNVGALSGAVRAHVRLAATFAGSSEEESKLGKQRMTLAKAVTERSSLVKRSKTLPELVDPTLKRLEDMELMDDWESRSSSAGSRCGSSQAGDPPEFNRSRRSTRSTVLCVADARREEGVRRLRRADFLGAAQILEAAWDLVEEEFPRALMSSRRRNFVESARSSSRIGERSTGKTSSGRQSRQTCKTPHSDRGTPLPEGTSLPGIASATEEADGAAPEPVKFQLHRAVTSQDLEEKLGADDANQSLSSSWESGRRDALGHSKLVHKKTADDGVVGGDSRGSSVRGSIADEFVTAEGDLQRAIIEAASMRVAANASRRNTVEVGATLAKEEKPGEEPKAAIDTTGLLGKREAKEASAEEAATEESVAPAAVEPEDIEELMEEVKFVQGQASISATEKKAKMPILMALSLAFLRLQNWERLDVIAEMGLEICGKMMPTTCGVDLHSEADEQNWVVMMIRRGVACAFLGPDNFQRGRGYFEEVRKIQPKNRDAKRGMQCMAFLQAQLPLGPAAYEAALAAMASGWS